MNGSISWSSSSVAWMPAPVRIGVTRVCYQSDARLLTSKKNPRCSEFDPCNYCYAIVIMREVPSLPEEMKWTGGAGKVLCGDCIESLMGAASAEPHQRGPELEGLANEATWQRANSFFTNYSYAVWRIYRVRTWHADTVGSMTQHDDLAVHQLVQRVDKCFSACDCFRSVAAWRHSRVVQN